MKRSLTASKRRALEPRVEEHEHLIRELTCALLDRIEPLAYDLKQLAARLPRRRRRSKGNG